MINFLYPSFLLATGLIAIPIIIHFFNFQRPKKVYFTNVAFLQEVRTVSRSRNRLKNILVLLCRCLGIIFLALAFAQPFIVGQDAQTVKSGNHVSIYVDNSFSMQNEADHKTLLDLAVTNAEHILTLFPKSTLFQFIENGFRSHSRYFVDKKRVADSLGTLKYSPSTRAIKAIYDRQIDAFQTHHASTQHHIFWISDFQKNTSGDLSKLDLDTLQRFYLLPLQTNHKSNLYVDSVWLENPFVKKNENNTVFVKVKHTGQEPIEDKMIQLFIGDRQMSSTSISLKPNQSTEVALHFAVESAGVKSCRISLDDYPVTFDNDYFFTMRVAPPMKIVHISGTTTDFIPNVYGNEPYFKLQSHSIQNIDYQDINDANLVILQAVPEIDQALRASLIHFLRKGGNLVIFPTPDMNIESYRTVLNVALSKVPKANAQRIALNPPNTQNPFFDGIFDKVNKNINMPETQATITWNRTGRDLLTFKNTQPFLSQWSSGLNQNSQLFIFASPLEVEFSGLAKHALFVPIMYKIALSSHHQKERLSYSFSESSATLFMDSIRANDIFKLVPTTEHNQNPEFIPNQRVVGNQLILDIPKSGLQSGNFDVVRQKDGRKMASIAFNYNKLESEGTSYTLEELEKQFKDQPNVQIYDSADVKQFASSFQEKNRTQNLWRGMLILALLFFLLEILLIRFWTPRIS